MFEVFVKTHFSAAHHLRDYPGNCARWHGHNWEVTAFIQAPKLDALGISVDFRKLKTEIKAALECLDHTDLNAHPAFADVNPTSEVIARYLYRALADRLDDGNIKVCRVQVSETPSSGTVYSEA